MVDNNTVAIKPHQLQLWTLTHWGRDKMDIISQKTFLDTFSWMEMYRFWLKFHWNLLAMVELTIFQYWSRSWLGAGKATSHYLNQWWSSLLTHIFATRPKWVKSEGSRWDFENIGLPSRHCVVSVCSFPFFGQVHVTDVHQVYFTATGSPVQGQWCGPQNMGNTLYT